MLNLLDLERRVGGLDVEGGKDLCKGCGWGGVLCFEIGVLMGSPAVAVTALIGHQDWW
jgi:hypothetical protein